LAEEGEAAWDSSHVHPSHFQGTIHGLAELPGDVLLLLLLLLPLRRG